MADDIYPGDSYDDCLCCTCCGCTCLLWDDDEFEDEPQP